MSTFTINNRRYESAPLDFNAVCTFEDNGIKLDDLKKKPFACMRNYLALCSNLDLEDAGREIESHIINGGKLDDLINAMNTEIDKSDFFRALFATEETEVATETAKTTKKAK